MSKRVGNDNEGYTQGVHELSLAMSIVETATELARQQGAARVIDVTLRIGCLSCVHEEALRSSFMIARETTPLAESNLTVIPVPVRIWCPLCHAEQELADIQRFACPVCATRSCHIRAGRELELESISLDDFTRETTDGDTPHS